MIGPGLTGDGDCVLPVPARHSTSLNYTRGRRLPHLKLLRYESRASQRSWQECANPGSFSDTDGRIVGGGLSQHQEVPALLARVSCVIRYSFASHI